jgi:3'(2'), 5'-bisphosphate nucleotidase
LIIVADYAVQAIINHHLHYHFPNDPIVAEEDSKKLMQEPELLSQVTRLINSVLSKPMSEKNV